MKATIESTTRIVNLDSDGKVQARVWEGVTEGGVPFVAYIAVCQVCRNADNSEFVCDLHEHKEPDAATQRAIDLRLVI